MHSCFEKILINKNAADFVWRAVTRGTLKKLFYYKQIVLWMCYTMQARVLQEQKMSVEATAPSVKLTNYNKSPITDELYMVKLNSNANK